MKKLAMVISFLLILGLLGACGTSGTSNNQKNNSSGAAKNAPTKTLNMGTSADYPPYESIDTSSGNNNYVGFDIDIAKYITSQLGYKLKITNMNFDGLVAALQTKRVDFVMAGMTPTADRKKSIDFTDTYYSAQQLIMTRKDTNIKSIGDLKGKKVGVQLGSIQQKIAQQINQKTPITIDSLDKVNILVEELKSKRIDAMVIEDAVAAKYLQANSNFTAFKVPGQKSAGSAIAFPKNSPLTKQFNDELKKMKQDGKLDELVKKWFNVSNS